MIPQTPLCVADRNTYWVRKLFCKNELLAAMSLAGRVPLMVRRAKSGICRNFGAESAHSGKIALTVLALSCHSPRDNLTATTRTKWTLFLTNEWPLLYLGQHCESHEKRARALSRKIPLAKVRRKHALPASVGTGLHQALRSALEVNALGRQRIRPVTARAMIGRARDRLRGRLPMCLSPCQGHFDSRLKTIPVPVHQ